MKDRVSDKPRGFGFVTFVDEAVADKVCEEKHELQGRQVCPPDCDTAGVKHCSAHRLSQNCQQPRLCLQIDAKRSVPPQQQPRSKKLFVGGLAPATKEGKLAICMAG